MRKLRQRAKYGAIAYSQLTCQHVGLNFGRRICTLIAIFIPPDPTRPNCSVRCVGVTGVKWITIKDKSNVLFYLLPALRDVQLTTRLRCARQYPTIYARTTRYKNSFILFGLNHAFRGCQNPINGLCYRSRRVG